MNIMERKEIKVGDVLYKYGHYGHSMERVVVIRTTAKRAMSENRQFVKEYTDKVSEVGGGWWMPETEALKNEFELRIFKSKAKNLPIPFDEMTAQQLQQYIDFVQSFNK